MNLQQMRYFLTVAETGNITAAANLLHMAQPPLSRQIKQLEEELETELFDRSGRHLQLTETGVLLAHRAREILNLTERSLQEIRSAGQGISGTLYMGAVSTANYMLLPNLIKEFNKLYPQVHFQLVTEATTRITELLEKGILELGIVRMPFNSNFFDSYNLPEEKLMAILNTECHPLPLDKHTLTIAELAAYPLLLHKKYESLITNVFHKHHCRPQYFCRSNDTIPLLGWTEAGLGATILPQSAAIGEAKSKLAVYEIEDSELTTTGALVWLKKRRQSAAAAAFIKFFIEYFSALNTKEK